MEKIKQTIDLIAKEDMNSHGAKVLIEFAADHIPDGVKSILCIGFGSGYELELLSKKYEVTGIEANSKGVDLMKSRFDVHKMDMHDLKFPDKRFDLVFARDVFEHATAPFVAFAEMARVSKKYVLIVLPDDTWANSELHMSIPTLKQMVVLGMKQDLGLCVYNEQYHISGDIPFKEYYYVFRK